MNITRFKEYYKNMHQIGDIDPSVWMMNYIINRLELNENQILWYCFLFACTYHLPSAYLILNEFPDLELVEEERFNDFWIENQKNVPFQRDKLKQRKFLVDTIMSYKKLIFPKKQKEFFDLYLNKTPQENFDFLYKDLYKNIAHFGRFSVWNWIQLLNEVVGYDIHPNSYLFGSDGESHTHGMCLCFNKPEWAKKERYVEDGKRKKRVHKFSSQDLEFLETNTLKLHKELNDEFKKDNINGINTDLNEVNSFRIETVACAFKKLFRNNDSRYLGYYLDRQAEDIRKLEQQKFYGVDWGLLWEARKELLNQRYNDLSVKKGLFKLEIDDKINYGLNENKIFE